MKPCTIVLLQVLWCFCIFRNGVIGAPRKHWKRPKLVKPPQPEPKSAISIVNKMCRIYNYERYDYQLSRSSKTNKTVLKKELRCHKIVKRVTGGEEASKGEFPHMASIGYAYIDNENKKFESICGGSLISDKFVLSVAHCVASEPYLSKEKCVKLGHLNVKNDEGTLHQIKKIHIHEEYNIEDNSHDIALLEMDIYVKFTPSMRPICLHTSMELSPKERIAIITGWGFNHENTIAKESLQKAQVPVHHPSFCEEPYQQASRKFSRGFDHKRSICAGDTENNRDTCQGDSGGPLQIMQDDQECTYTQIGITSFGPTHCGHNGSPAVYTRVAYYIEWIQKIVWAADSVV